MFYVFEHEARELTLLTSFGLNVPPVTSFRTWEPLYGLGDVEDGRDSAYAICTTFAMRRLFSNETADLIGLRLGLAGLLCLLA